MIILYKKINIVSLSFYFSKIILINCYMYLEELYPDEGHVVYSTHDLNQKQAPHKLLKLVAKSA